jgi:hypothetical protein
VAKEPAASPGDGSDYYLHKGEDVLQFDIRELRQAYGALGKSAASRSVTIRRGQFVGSAGLDQVGMPHVSRIEPANVRAWDEAVTWTIETTRQTVTSTFRSGLDTLSTAIPWAVLERDPQAIALGLPVEIDVNGVVTALDAQTYVKLQDHVLADVSQQNELDLPNELTRIGGDFFDLQQFMRGVDAFFVVDSTIRRDDALQVATSTRASGSCVSICLGCAGSAVAGIGAYFALIAACGGALVTGGASALLCIAAFLGVQGTHVAMFGACGRCYECYTAAPAFSGQNRREPSVSRLPESSSAKRRPGSATPLP